MTYMILMSTHNPILALMGDRRIVIKNGGIDTIVETNRRKRENLKILQMIDVHIADLRSRIRSDGQVDFDIEEYFRYQDDLKNKSKLS